MGGSLRGEGSPPFVSSVMDIAGVVCHAVVNGRRNREMYFELARVAGLLSVRLVTLTSNQRKNHDLVARTIIRVA